jgi:hypothetical protein
MDGPAHHAPPSANVGSASSGTDFGAVRGLSEKGGSGRDTHRHRATWPHSEAEPRHFLRPCGPLALWPCCLFVVRPRYSLRTPRTRRATGQFYDKTGRFRSKTDRFQRATDRFRNKNGRFQSATGRFQSKTGQFQSATGRVKEVLGPVPPAKVHAANSCGGLKAFLYTVAGPSYPRSLPQEPFHAARLDQAYCNEHPSRDRPGRRVGRARWCRTGSVTRMVSTCPLILALPHGGVRRRTRCDPVCRAK